MLKRIAATGVNLVVLGVSVKTVFQDDNASMYIPGEAVTGVVGGVVAQPIFSGRANRGVYPAAH